jgi:integrase
VARDTARETLRDREIQAAQGKLRNRPQDVPRFAEFAEGFLAGKQPRVRISTWEGWRASIREHLLPIFGEMKLDAIKRQHVEDFLRTKTEAKKHEASTINVTLRHLKAILEDALAHDYIEKNPARGVKPLRDERDSEEDEVRAFSLEQWQTFFEAARTTAREPWATLFLFAYGTGMRRNEVLGLQWQEVDLMADPAMVYVRYQLGREGQRVALKTSCSRREIDIAPEVVADLLELPRGDDPKRDWVFRNHLGRPIDPSELRKVFKRVLDAAGLPGIFTFHSLRHTHASVLFDPGKDLNGKDLQSADLKQVQYRLGHSSVAITANTYTHFIRPERKHIGHLAFGNRTATERKETRNPAPIAAL